ncbi:MAG: DUF92 domain-containing protein [Gemmatimonadales bacterium]
MLAGFALATIIALAAHAKRSLSASGALAAVAVATACAAAGWSWAWMLIAFFTSATLLSKFGEGAKRARTGDIVEKGGERDVWQVLANGGVFAALAIASLAWPSVLWQAAGAGAIAASTSDTWATEIGTLSSAVPRSIITRTRVPPGTSGGVTPIGTITGLAGAIFIAIVALLAGWPLRAACAAIVGGFAGSLVDSIVGASIQRKRWCEQCGHGTERAVHTCGTVTMPAGGFRWLGNDLVNLVSTIGGACLGSLCLL